MSAVFDFIQNQIQSFQAWENAFDTLGAIQFTKDHLEIPIIVVGLYILMVHQVPEFMKGRDAIQCKSLFAIWNLCLSIFSIMGSVTVIPHLVHYYREKGFEYTICEAPEKWQFHPPRVGLWITLFIYSKLPELIDTVFLVIRKKKVIFLHWFHHTTVLLYCWHAFHNKIPPGIWFASMNFFVHAIMYFYYFCTNIGLFRFVSPFAPLITFVQIAQMVGGMFVLLSVAKIKLFGGAERDFYSCDVDEANWKLGLIMYLCYFALFVALFYQKYIVPGEKTAANKICFSNPNNVGASGFFHATKEKRSKKKSE